MTIHAKYNEKTPTVGVGPDIDQYLLHNTNEIANVLRDSIQKRSFVTIYFNRGEDFVVTNFLSVDTTHNEVILDLGANKLANQRLLEASEATIVTFVDQIKVQFSVSAVRQTVFEGGAAFLIDLPESVLRLQRRNYFRIPTPKLRPIECLVPAPGAASGKFVFKVVDIGVGGIGVMSTIDKLPLQHGMTFENCQIDIPEQGKITTTLEIRNIIDTVDGRGTPSRRVGCQFINMPGQAVLMLQRYINQIDRERRKLVG
jgi:c-di-GMP-binding flagellar brake protein YcgR